MISFPPTSFRPTVAVCPDRRGGRGAFFQVLPWLWRVLLPLLTGGLCYLLGRDLQGLVMADWLPITWSGPVLDLPDWVIYQLPDGLWLYAFLQQIRMVWGTPLPPGSFPWIATLLLLAFGSELLQSLHFIPGTGDWGDVVAYVAGGLGVFVPKNTKH